MVYMISTDSMVFVLLILAYLVNFNLLTFKKNYVHLVKQQTLPQGVRILLNQAAQTVQNGRPWWSQQKDMHQLCPSWRSWNPVYIYL